MGGEDSPGKPFIKVTVEVLKEKEKGIIAMSLQHEDINYSKFRKSSSRDPMHEEISIGDCFRRKHFEF